MSWQPRISLSAQENGDWSPKQECLDQYPHLAQLTAKHLADLYDLVFCFGQLEKLGGIYQPWKIITSQKLSNMCVIVLLNMARGLVVNLEKNCDPAFIQKIELWSNQKIEWHQSISLEKAVAFIEEVDSAAARLAAICPFTGRRINFAIYDDPKLKVKNIFRKRGYFLPIPPAGIIDNAWGSNWKLSRFIKRFDQPEKLILFADDAFPIRGLCLRVDQNLTTNRSKALLRILQDNSLNPELDSSWQALQINPDLRSAIKASYEKLHLT